VEADGAQAASNAVRVKQIVPLSGVHPETMLGQEARNLLGELFRALVDAQSHSVILS
jgi:hypothetical protein